MAQQHDLIDLRQKLKPPENLEQAERNMEYIRFVVNDDINKMMTFLSIEEFEKVRLELQLAGLSLKESNADQIEKAYVSAYGKLAEENKFLSVVKLREMLRKENDDNNEIVKRINSVVDVVKRNFLLKEEVAGMLYAILCNRKYDLCLRKKLHDISKENKKSDHEMIGKWEVKYKEQVLQVEKVKCEIEGRKFPDIRELRETFKFFDELSMNVEKKSNIEVNKVFSTKKNIKCHHCQKMGHIMKECWLKNPELRNKARKRNVDFKSKVNHRTKKVETLENDYDETDEDEECKNIMMLAAIEGEKKIMMKTIMSGENWFLEKEMEADTGCRITVVPEKWFSDTQLQGIKKGQFKFIKGVGGGKKDVVGNLKIKMVIKNKQNKESKMIDTEIMVIRDLQDALLGREDLHKFGLIDDLQSMAVKVVTQNNGKVDKNIENFKRKFPILTSKTPGKVKGVLVKLKYHRDRKKYFCKPREYKSSVLKELVDKKIDYYIEQGIYEPIMYSDEAYPIVPVLKGLSKIKNQSELTIDNIRITGDFSLYNKGLVIPSVCIRTVNGELEKINLIEGKEDLIYSVFDLSDGYTSLEMEPGTKTILSTPKGLMLVKRLSQGLASAPALYSMFMESKIVSVLEKEIKNRQWKKKVQILNIMDDLMIVSRDPEVNEGMVDLLGELLEKLNVRINIDKLKLGKKSVDFCGVTLSQTGYSVGAGRVEKLLAMKVPENASQLKSFLGLCNTMIKHVKNLAKYKRTLEVKLNGIRTKKEAYKFEKFNEKEIEMFNQLKNVIANQMIENCLVDVKEIIEYRIQSDASAEAIGSMLEGKIRTKEGMKWLPLECHSKCFQGSQKKWPIQHKEAYGLYDAVKRWFGRIIGVKTTLLTDHESLTKVFSPGPNGLANKTYSARIWRWAQSLLSVGTLEISYKGQKSVAFADCLSRLTDAQFLGDEEDETIAANHINFLENRTFTLKEVRDLGKEDVEYQEWLNSIKNGKVPECFKKQEDVHVEGNVIKIGYKTVLPFDLQKEVLKIAHESHMGKKGLKYRLDKEFWWPQMSKDIHETCEKCEECIKYMRAPNKKEKEWEKASYFLQRVHVDQGQFWNTRCNFLVMRDSYTGYVQAKIVQNERPEEFINFIEEIEKYMGNITSIVTDQQRSMVSTEVKKKFANKQFLVVGTEVHKSNGLAEGIVREIKKRARKMDFSSAIKHNQMKILSKIVEDINKVPCGENVKSPNEMIFQENVNKDRILLQIVTTEKPSKYIVGEKILFKLSRMECFEKGIVIENIGSQICKVKRISNNREYIIHNDSIRKDNRQVKNKDKDNFMWDLLSEEREENRHENRNENLENVSEIDQLDKQIENQLREIEAKENNDKMSRIKYKNPKLPSTMLNMSLRNQKQANPLSMSSRTYSKPWRT